MPLGKYYCDYCDKEFQDTAAARRRHLQGTQHRRAKALWYDSITRDPNCNPTELLQKGVCNRFVNTGFCPYGDSCRYLHPKSNPLNTNTQVFDLVLHTPAGVADNIQSQSMASNQLAGGSFSQDYMVRDSMGMSWGNLPPSLKPPPESGYPPLPFVDWG